MIEVRLHAVYITQRSFCPFFALFSVRLSKNKLKSNVEELQSLNTLQNDENVTLQRDKLLLTDEICDLQSKVKIVTMFTTHSKNVQRLVAI